MITSQVVQVRALDLAGCGRFRCQCVKSTRFLYAGVYCISATEVLVSLKKTDYYFKNVIKKHSARFSDSGITIFDLPSNFNLYYDNLSFLIEGAAYLLVWLILNEYYGTFVLAY